MHSALPSFYLFPFDRSLSRTHLGATRTNRERKSLSRPRVSLAAKKPIPSPLCRQFISRLARRYTNLETSSRGQKRALSQSRLLGRRKNSFVNIRRSFLICAPSVRPLPAPLPPSLRRFSFLSSHPPFGRKIRRARREGSPLFVAFARGPRSITGNLTKMHV